MNLRDYLDEQDEKSGNTLGSDLWRLATEAQNALGRHRFAVSHLAALEQQLKKQIERIEQRWREGLALEEAERRYDESQPGDRSHRPDLGELVRWLLAEVDRWREAAEAAGPDNESQEHDPA